MQSFYVTWPLIVIRFALFPAPNGIDCLILAEKPQVLLLKDPARAAKRNDQIKDKMCRKEMCVTIKLSKMEENCGTYRHLRFVLH